MAVSPGHFLRGATCLFFWWVCVACGGGEGTRIQVVEAEPPPASGAVEEALPVAEAPPAPNPADVLEARLKPPADVGEAPAGLEKTRSGIAWKRLGAGDGKDTPRRDDTVWVHYTSWKPDGRVSGSSYRKGQPRIVKMSKTLKGWREMLSEMVVGERRLAWLPAKLAHPKSKKVNKTTGRRVLDIELVKLKQAPPSPPDVKRAPKDAERTPTGLASRVITAGTGKVHPTRKSHVTVRYAGWTTDGRCFDHTAPDETTGFDLGGVIAGWTEGLQLMVQGEKRRFWIPEALAYAGKPGKPRGMLVFDVELLAIEP